MSAGSANHTGMDIKPKRITIVALPLIFFAGMVVIFLYALNAGDPSNLPSALIGKPAPQFKLAKVENLVFNGKELPGLETADLAKGRVSIVNFWASWCGPCQIEHPFLMDLAEAKSVLMYSINYKNKAKDARRFLRNFGNPFDAVGADPDGRVGIEWGVAAMPETFVINGKGIVTYKHVGPIVTDEDKDGMMKAIRDAKG